MRTRAQLNSHGSAITSHRSPFRVGIAVTTGFLLLAPDLRCGAAEDWPQWRGPNRDGISTETGLLKDWPAGGPPLLWKATGLGEGYSTVSVSAGRIFTIGDRSGASFVVAVNVADGKPVWSAKLGKAGAPGGYVGPRAAPTIGGELPFAVGQYGELACLESATGKERWRKDYTKD